MSRTTCVLIATNYEGVAKRAARSYGLEPELVLNRFDCARSLADMRSRVRRSGLRVAAIHSADWTRQPLQRLYELAILRLPVDRRLVVDGDRLLELRPSELVAGMARLPLDLASGGIAALREASPARVRSKPRIAASQSRSNDVLVLWCGDPAVRTGGSVTHAAGMLGAFRALGLRVGLVTSCEPPTQVLENIDELEIAAPLPPSRRLTRELEQLTLNAPLRTAAGDMLRRLHPRFIYQRYAAFMTAGLWLAAGTGVPLVAEWNSSAVWVRANWQEGHAVKRLFDPVLAGIERRTLREATLVRAVSQNAADVAAAMGASRDRIKVIPNGVDPNAIPMHTSNGSTPRDAARLGWVGSFGPWHGAHVVVEALASLPQEIAAVMIGDGEGRSECQQLAERLGVADRIEWTGMLPHEEAVRALSQCDLLLSPHVGSGDQRFFGSPTKLFEYMAIGLPIVASDLEQIAEVLDDGATAKLVPPGDPLGLAEGVIRVLNSPDRGASLGLAARKRVEDHHTWTMRAQAVVDALESIRTMPPRGE